MWDSKVLAAGVAIAACGFFAVVSQRKGAKAGGAVKISSEPGTLGKKGSSKKKEMGQEEPKTKMQEKPAASQAPRIEMYFGSQTGKAEELAKSLAAEGRLRGYDARAVDMSKLDPSKELPGTNAIFLVATYGDGDPTDNAKACTKWLCGDAQEGALSGMRYCVFGLGNTLYEKYNTVGKLYDEKCSMLGGKRIFDLGLGDDDGSMQEDFDQWREMLWPVLNEAFGLESGGEGAVTGGYLLDVSLHQSKQEALESTGGMVESTNRLDRDDAGIMEMKVIVNRELHTGGDRSCRHIELGMHAADADADGGAYVTGDHVAILPKNDAARVSQLAKRLNVEPSQWVSVKDAAGEAPFPNPCTVEDVLSLHLDIGGAPKRAAVEALADLARDEEEKARLMKMAAKDKAGREELYAFVNKGKRGVIDLLFEFPSIEAELCHLIELVPRLQPRYYSISSASVTHPSEVHVTAVVVKDDGLAGGRVFKGVCTNYLKDLNEGDAVSAFLRSTPFKLPPSPATSVIMVGAGTGIAPLRGMIAHLSEAKKQGSELGENMLIFGCRSRCDDYLYEEEISAAKKAKVLTHVHTAFSRDDPWKKVYVQNRIDERSRKILELLDAGAHFYVCGGALMAKDVRKALQACLIFMRGMKDGKADEYLERLSAEGRYHQDVWS